MKYRHYSHKCTQETLAYSYDGEKLVMVKCNVCGRELGKLVRWIYARGWL